MALPGSLWVPSKKHIRVLLFLPCFPTIPRQTEEGRRKVYSNCILVRNCFLVQRNMSTRVEYYKCVFEKDPSTVFLTVRTWYTVTQKWLSGWGIILVILTVKGICLRSRAIRLTNQIFFFRKVLFSYVCNRFWVTFLY